MQLVIEGDSLVAKKLNKLPEFLKKTFWIGVQEDFEKNLLNNVKEHSKSGRLERNSYVDIIDNGVEGGVRNNGMMVNTKRGPVNYGVFVEYGTKPHTIEPSKKKALRFISNGQFVFTKRVEHPGYKGSQFLYKSAKKTFENLERIFDKELKNKGIT